MRIGIDARPLANPNSGIGRYTQNILSRLKEFGDHDYFLYATSPIKTTDIHCNNIRTLDISSQHLNSILAQIWFPIWGMRDRLDLFWSPRHHLPLMMKAQTIVTVHDLVWQKAPTSMKRFGHLIERILMPPSIAKANAVIAVSNATLEDLKAWRPQSGSKTQVIYEAPFTHISTADHIPSSRGHILFLGTFEPRKNIATLLDAYTRLDKPPKLILAGGPGWNFDINKEVDQRGLSASVEIVTARSDAELSKLFLGAMFLVLPSFYEGFGLPVIEAMAHGRAVIASNVSAMPEIVGDTGVLFNPNSTAELVSAMESLIFDESHRHVLEQKALKRAHIFSWDKAARETYQLLTSFESNA